MYIFFKFKGCLLIYLFLQERKYIHPIMRPFSRINVLIIFYFYIIQSKMICYALASHADLRNGWYLISPGVWTEFASTRATACDASRSAAHTRRY